MRAATATASQALARPRTRIWRACRKPTSDSSSRTCAAARADRIPQSFMTVAAKSLDNAEIVAAARYFAGQPRTSTFRIVESRTALAVHVENWALAADRPARQASPRQRLLELPDDPQDFASRDTHARYTVYVPIGSIARGRALVERHGATACAACHGQRLQGQGTAPPLIGQSPTYLLRQLIDFSRGARNGRQAGAVAAIAQSLSMDDMIAVAAYAASDASPTSPSKSQLKPTIRWNRWKRARRSPCSPTGFLAASSRLPLTAYLVGTSGVAMPRIYRQDTDSRALAVPRTFTRVFCERSKLAETVRFYEVVAGQSLDQDIDLSENGMRIVAVGGFLILLLDPDKVDSTRYEQARNTVATVIVPYLDAATCDAKAAGAEQIGERFSAPHASGCRLRHPDGLVIEYLEHRPSQFDEMGPGSFFS
jgi:cytochrome c553